MKKLFFSAVLFSLPAGALGDSFGGGPGPTPPPPAGCISANLTCQTEDSKVSIQLKSTGIPGFECLDGISIGELKPEILHFPGSELSRTRGNYFNGKTLVAHFKPMRVARDANDTDFQSLSRMTFSLKEQRVVGPGGRVEIKLRGIANYYYLTAERDNDTYRYFYDTHPQLSEKIIVCE